MEKINNLNAHEIFSSKGVMGRHEYMKVIGLLFVVMLVTFFIISSVFFSSETGPVEGSMFLWVVMYFACAYVAVVNSFKRMRDIRGQTTGDELPYQVGLVVLLLIPYVNFVTLAILCFMKGSITENSQTYSNLTSGFSERFTPQKGGKVSDLEQLYELKQKGAIDEAEYLRLKDEILTKK